MNLYFYRYDTHEDYLGEPQYKPVEGSTVNRVFDDHSPFELPGAPRVAMAQLLNKLKDGWRGCGWEGDGEIEYAMLPPYAFNDADSWQPVFHVKQENDGISFVASLEPMLSKNLQRT
jgi:hypothetical protein